MNDIVALPHHGSWAGLAAVGPHCDVRGEPGPNGGATSEWTPIDDYLRAQRQLTAVEHFSRHQDTDLLPPQARRYQSLIPFERPHPGQQYGFEVDLDRCTGCKACVTACHSLNGLDAGESFRSVGLLIGERPAADPAPTGDPGRPSAPAAPMGGTVVEPWQQAVTTACHHCVDPACLNGCPVDAYQKDPVTGIVRHLDDQCIGCSYCTLTCPYEVPRYNARLGIVRKCDLCADRLAVGEAPACVQACPTSAISVAVIDVVDALDGAASGVELVPSAPRSDLTVPTTRYRSSRPIPVDATPGDQYALRPAHAHRPLAVMLVLTQASVGAFVAARVLDVVGGAALAGTARPFAAGGALIVGVVALVASVAHLGRPQYAWRAVIGLRHSWLSREIVLFSVFAGSATLYAAAVWLSAPPPATSVVGVVVVVSGGAGIACSATIYAVTGRRWWRLAVTGPKFGLSAAITGPSLAMALTVLAVVVEGHRRGPEARGLHAVSPLLLAVVAATVAKLVLEATILTHLRSRRPSELARTARLLTEDLRALSVQRIGGALLGGLVGPLLLAWRWAGSGRPASPSAWDLVVVVAMLVANLAGELAERRTFFSAVSSPRMPGAPR